MSSTPQSKVSPAFAPFFEDSDSHVKDAIVVFRPPPVDTNRVRGRLRSLQARLDFVQEQATRQATVQNQVFKAYRDSSSSRYDLAMEPVGSPALPIASFEVTRQSVKKLAEQPEVLAVLPNQRVRLIEPLSVRQDLLRDRERAAGRTWGLHELGIQALWKETKGKDINVAVLDTGVRASHPALAGRVTDYVFITPLGERIEVGQPFDGGQHGTHVCGTIAGGTTPDGVAIGVAPEANLLVGNVLSGEATLRTIIEGIAWAVEKGADIINLSLGMTYYEPKFEEFFDLLLNQYSILPVVAIGNENHGNTSSPGSAFSALSVGAAEQTGRGPRRLGIAPFSSGASLVFPGALEKAMVTKPDVVAPGASVYSCIPALPGKMEYAYMDGTSMATPHVAGVAALLMAAYPEASAVDIATALRETSWHPRGNMLRPDNRWGHGMIEPMKAFQFLSTLT